jgi:Holliday junction resolvasome RuvABC DNA-binding subunit
MRWRWPWDRGDDDALHYVAAALRLQTKEIQRMALNLEKLAAEVARNTSVDTSAVQAITGLNTSVQELKQQVADLIALGGDPAAIQAAIDAFADQMAQSTDALAAAIPANTEPPTP